MVWLDLWARNHPRWRHVPISSSTSFATCHLLQGTGMMGVPGIASAIFSTVRDAGINVIMISQVSVSQTTHGLCSTFKSTKCCDMTGHEIRLSRCVAGIVETLVDIHRCFVLRGIPLKVPCLECTLSACSCNFGPLLLCESLCFQNMSQTSHRSS